jgi:hypothetical protein
MIENPPRKHSEKLENLTSLGFGDSRIIPTAGETTNTREKHFLDDFH